ncbi:FAD/NAD(P)-binding protein [Actinoplanes flavus]|uniref:FAD/NAD(P)-binding protein n=1 Tax=Actinoplanes flavus TaxID=2820290 RepID=A0ABS3UX68_9ACTN|nr:FAD/NAD(P)-binding protein [Actinoplanes flavus]MBO3743179.1 FAD/NAD(P)-binding protein [Actinoplanes flavus]
MTSTVIRRSGTASDPATHAGTVVIIGGGAGGVLAACALMRCPDYRVILIGPGTTPGPGVAYGTARPWHLLNSRAAAMSADPGDPRDLLRWSHARGRPLDPADFLPRADYGAYLADRFTHALGSGRLDHRRATATAVRPYGDGHLVLDDTGTATYADHVVLALGNPPPHRLPGISDAAHDSGAYIADPWAPGALDAVPHDQPVLLLGAGLTAVDVALTLTERGRGRRTPLDLISRRGLLPLAHPDRPPAPLDLDLPASSDLAPLLRAVRAAVAAGADWTAVVDAVRCRADDLWTGLGHPAQDRFLRHCQRLWEIHRHRMAPAVAARVDRLRRDGDLRVRAGRISSVEPRPAGGLTVTINGETPQRYATVVACTGPAPAFASPGPLLGALLGEGLLRPGPHRLGVDTDPDGRAGPGLWVIGPLRRGHLWETTAIPEIRGQAERLATAVNASRVRPAPTTV